SRIAAPGLFSEFGIKRQNGSGAAFGLSDKSQTGVRVPLVRMKASTSVTIRTPTGYISPIAATASWGSTSGGTEEDVGTMCPAIMEDSSGSQILIRYGQGYRPMDRFERITPVPLVEAQARGLGSGVRAER
ncbi:MAG: hypothetical protein M3Z23_13185, partial [Acidobacteriota bacterium]|nr:hypothetical protein [Acidobacteriota bacterium]